MIPIEAVPWRWLDGGLLLAVCWFDLRERRIPNTLVLLGSLTAILHADLHYTLGQMLLGGVVGALLLLPFALWGSLGMGDIKLALWIGLLVGWPAVVDALVLGTFVAAVVAVIGLLTHRWHLRSGIPYGPFLVLGVFTIWVMR